MTPDRFFAVADLAAFYDAFCPRERRPDFDLYRPLLMASGGVLDVGCGTGALLKEARALGHHGRLCGLDPAPGMLAQARRATDIDWVLGDLSSADLAGPFDLIVMTGHAFQVLLTDAEIARALTAIRTLLADGGRFAFETRNPLAREWEAWTAARTSEVQDAHGRTVRMARQVEYYDGELLTFTHTFTSPDWPYPAVSRSTLRFIDAPRLNRLLADAGFQVEAQLGDWDGSPLSPSAPEIITIATAPGPRGK